MGVTDTVIGGISATYTNFLTTLPGWIQEVVNVFLWIILIFIYAIVIWKFYRFIAKKNIITLNLNKYNRSEHPVFSKVLGGALYLVEYILILPILVFFWFSVFAILLILVAENLDIQRITLISAVIIGAIRLVSYTPRYGQALAKEVSKLLPFTLLGIAITRPDFVFEFTRVIENVTQIPAFFQQIFLYLMFIYFLEIVLRVLDLLLGLLGLKDPDPTDEEAEAEKS
jgi:hypothetical protein